MRTRTDDMLYRVDRTWLGPKIIRFPWRATYQAYAIAALVGAVSGVAGWKLGVSVNFITVVIWFTCCLLISRQITKALDPDRPIGAALVRLGQDLSAPRPTPAKVEESTQHLIVRRWRYGTQPETRRLVRLAMVIRDGTANTGRRTAGAMTRAGGLVGALGQILARISKAIARGVRHTPETIARHARNRRKAGDRISDIDEFPPPRKLSLDDLENEDEDDAGEDPTERRPRRIAPATTQG